MKKLKANTYKKNDVYIKVNRTFGQLPLVVALFDIVSQKLREKSEYALNC